MLTARKKKTYNYRNLEDNKSLEDYRQWCALWYSLVKGYCQNVLITSGLQNLYMWFGIEKPKWILCWYKKNSQSGCALRGLNRWEPIIFYSEYEPIIFYGNLNKIVPQDTYVIEDKKSDVYNVNTAYIEDGDLGGSKFSLCPKPVKLWSLLMRDFSRAENTVVDLFLGSGTALLAAERMNRKLLACEIDPWYMSLSLERYISYVGTSEHVFRLNQDGTKTPWNEIEGVSIK